MQDYGSRWHFPRGHGLHFKGGAYSQHGQVGTVRASTPDNQNLIKHIYDSRLLQRLRSLGPTETEKAVITI
jgi:hypothetical protein